MLASAEGIQGRVRTIGELLTSTEARLREIASRGFFSRVFANTGRDLALAMNDVLQLQQYTVAIVLCALELHAHNVEMLEVMRAELDRLHGGLGQAARHNEGQAEGLVQVRATVGHMLLVLERQIVSARSTRAAQEDMTEEARNLTEASTRRANISLALSAAARSHLS